MASLNESLWPQRARADLLRLFASIPSPHNLCLPPDGLPEGSLSGQNVQIIAAANTPISWVYPAFWAFRLGCPRVSVLMPSLRADDPLTGRVRQQISDLAQKVGECLQQDLQICEKTANFSLVSGSRTVVFGSEHTMEWFREAAVRTGARVVCLGPFLNSVRWAPDMPSGMLTTWLARGCLTPVLLRVEETWTADNSQALVDAISRDLIEQWRSHGLRPDQTLHSHTTWWAESMGVAVYRRGSVMLADLRPISLKKLPPGIDAEQMGGGFYCLVHQSDEDLWTLPWVGEHDPFPNFWDTHQGKTWAEWLVPLLDSDLPGSDKREPSTSRSGLVT